MHVDLSNSAGNQLYSTVKRTSGAHYLGHKAACNLKVLQRSPKQRRHDGGDAQNLLHHCAQVNTVSDLSQLHFEKDHACMPSQKIRGMVHSSAKPQQQVLVSQG